MKPVTFSTKELDELELNETVVFDIVWGTVSAFFLRLGMIVAWNLTLGHILGKLPKGAIFEPFGPMIGGFSYAQREDLKRRILD